MADAKNEMIKKEFTQEQVQLVITGLDMYFKSMARRATSDTEDQEAKNLWLKKGDQAQVLITKMRLT